MAAEPHLSESRAPSPAVQNGTRLQGGKVRFAVQVVLPEQQEDAFHMAEPHLKDGVLATGLNPFL